MPFLSYEGAAALWSSRLPGTGGHRINPVEFGQQILEARQILDRKCAREAGPEDLKVSPGQEAHCYDPAVSH